MGFVTMAPCPIWCHLKDSTCQAVLRASRLPEEVRRLGLHSVVSYKDPDWYSPSASTCMRPVAEMLALRYARETGDIALMEKVWLCRLIGKRSPEHMNTLLSLC